MSEEGETTGAWPCAGLTEIQVEGTEPKLSFRDSTGLTSFRLGTEMAVRDIIAHSRIGTFFTIDSSFHLSYRESLSKPPR